MPPSVTPGTIAGMPAYNEAKYIGTMVLKTRQYVDEVIVVDDGSTDDTAEIARLAGATVIRHDSNRGYGAAIQSIMAEARKRMPDILVLLDADTQHNPGDIPRLVKPINEGYDIVIGSRVLQSNRIPTYRRLGQKVLLYFTRLLSGARLSDTECGFRVFSKKAIQMLELKESGMAVSAETVAEAAGKGLKVAELPVSVIYTRDSSTLNPVAHGMGVLARIIAMISERKPLFFFGWAGIILFILGIVAGIRVLNLFSRSGLMPVGTALVSATFIIVSMFCIFTGIILHVLARRRSAVNNQNH